MRALIPRAPQRAVAVAALVVAALIGCGVRLTQRGSSAGTYPGTSVKASRGDVVVSVGGVGRIVTGSGVAAIDVPAAGAGTGAGASTTGTTSGSSNSAPADAVFPRAAGHIARFLVKPGQHVMAGQPIAVLDDNGASASAAQQAQLDVESARLELQQKQHIVQDSLILLPCYNRHTLFVHSG